MAQHFVVHPTHPQPRLVRQAAAILRDGGVIAYPTDSSYALGCHLGDIGAEKRLRAIRGLGDAHYLTLVCRDLAAAGHFARLSNWQFRIVRQAIPGPYTFLLPATREVPRRLQHPKRNTVGLRVPDHPVALALLEALGEPLLSCTLMLPHEPMPPSDPFEIRDLLQSQLDLVIDGGYCGIEPTTVLDLTDGAPQLIRAGAGPLDKLGLA